MKNTLTTIIIRANTDIDNLYKVAEEKHNAFVAVDGGKDSKASDVEAAKEAAKAACDAYNKGVVARLCSLCEVTDRPSETFIGYGVVPFLFSSAKGSGKDGTREYTFATNDVPVNLSWLIEYMKSNPYSSSYKSAFSVCRKSFCGNMGRSLTDGKEQEEARKAFEKEFDERFTTIFPEGMKDKYSKKTLLETLQSCFDSIVPGSECKALSCHVNYILSVMGKRKRNALGSYKFPSQKVFTELVTDCLIRSYNGMDVSLDMGKNKVKVTDAK